MNDSTHRAICSVCGKFDQSHKEKAAERTNLVEKNKTHKYVCELCGRDLRYEDHEWGVYESIGDTKHQRKCIICGIKEDSTPNHSLTYVTTDPQKHWQVCSVCKYKSAEADHVWFTNYNATDHWQECSVCGKIKDGT